MGMSAAAPRKIYGRYPVDEEAVGIIKPKKQKQPFHTQIRSVEKFDNYSLSTLSQTDIISIKKAKPPKKVGLYKYKGTYGKKEEQTTLLSESLYNSFNRKNSRELTGVSETLNESSSQVFEFISDGKMDKSMVKKSNDKTTIDNYIEYIDNKEEDIKNSKVDINNIYQNKKKYK